MRRLLQRAALAASLALVLGVTLHPAAGPNRFAPAPWTTQHLHPVDVVGNVALFALPSAVLWSFGWSLRRTVVAGLVLSVGIELLQLAVPGRFTTTADVFFNTLGAAAGWLVAREYWGHGRGVLVGVASGAERDPVTDDRADGERDRQPTEKRDSKET